jgi:hypothetical protein
MKILLAVASLIPILPLVPEVLGSSSGEPAYLNAAPMPDFAAAREEAVRFLSDYQWTPFPPSSRPPTKLKPSSLGSNRCSE